MTTQTHPDAQTNIRCPKCRGRIMRKERIPVEKEHDFFLDVCRDCNVVWFDGGELARLQIQYESSMKALEAYAFQQKAQHRTEEEEEEIQRNLAALPTAENWLVSVVYENWLAVTLVVLFVLTPILMTPNLFGLHIPILVPAATSLGGTLCLGRLCVRMIEGGRHRLNALVVVMLVEVFFLGYVFYIR